MFKPTWILLKSGENMFQVTDELNKSYPNSQINAANKFINIRGMAKNAHVRQATLEPFKHSLYIRTVSYQYLLSALQDQLRPVYMSTKQSNMHCTVHPDQPGGNQMNQSEMFCSSNIFVTWFWVIWSLQLRDFLSVFTVLPILPCKM